MQGMIIDWISHNARNQPEKTATIELPSGRRQTYKEMDDRVGRIASWLADLGVGPGDRVGVLALSSGDAIDIIFATWRLGAVHLALNFRLTPPELDYIIGNAEPDVVIYDRELQSTLDGLTVEIPHTIETEGQGADSDFERRTAAAEPRFDRV